MSDITPLSFNLHTRVSDLRQEHGLQRRDYDAYRRYCTRRIRRLRSRTGLTHINGVKKQRTKFSYTAVNSDNFSLQNVEIVLLECERAWAAGQALKAEYHDLKEENSRIRVHYLGRFRKAVKLSANLEKILSSAPSPGVDELSCLEAEVYARWMTGVYGLENEDWGRAKVALGECKEIYSVLAKGRADGEAAPSSEAALFVKEVFRKQLSKAQDMLDMCTYWMSQEALEEEGEIQQGEPQAEVAPAKLSLTPDAIQMRVLQILHRRKKEKGAEGTTLEVVFLGVPLPVESDRFRDLYDAALRLEKELEQLQAVTPSTASNRQSQADLYDRLLTLFRDLRVALRDDMRRFQFREKAFQDNLNRLHTFVDHRSLLTTVARNRLLIRTAEAQLGADLAIEETGSTATRKRSARPEDVVRLYELIIQSLAEAKELPLVSDSDAEQARLNGKQELYHTLKCFALSRAYSAKDRYKEAFGLLGRAAERYPEAMAALVDEADKTYLRNYMEEHLERSKAVARAKHFLQMEEEAERKAAAAAGGSGKLAAEASARLRTAGRISILEDLDTYREVKKRNAFLVHFPPSYQHVPPKPLFFDIASGFVPQFPDLEKRKKKKGWFGSLFGRN